MAAPTSVATYTPGTNWTGTGSKSVNVTVSVGDRLVVLAAAENGAAAIGAPSMTGVTFTAIANTGSSNVQAQVRAWSGVATSAGTFSLTQSCSLNWGLVVRRYAGSDGIGASVAVQINGSGSSPSSALVTTDDNSSIDVIVADWDANDGASRAWLNVTGAAPTELAYFHNSSIYTVYSGTYADVGTAGSKTPGLSAPTGDSFAFLAVEVLGAEPAPPNEGSANFTLSLALEATGSRESSGTADFGLNLTLAATGDSPLPFVAESNWGTLDETLTDPIPSGTANFSLNLTLAATGEAEGSLSSSWGTLDVSLVVSSPWGTLDATLTVGATNALRIWNGTSWVPAIFRRHVTGEGWS